MLESKRYETDLASARLNSQSSSARPIFHIGSPAVYINPKQIIHENNNYQRSDIEANSQIQMNFNNQLNTFQYNKSRQKNHNNQNIHLLKYQSKILKTIEGLIFILFFMGSFDQPRQFRYLDIAGNVLTGLKIIGIHIFLYVLNTKLQKQNKGIQREDNKILQFFYLNRIQRHQLIQIWSIIISILLPIFVNNSVIFTILNCLRVLRLFFPFYVNNSSSNKWRLSLFAQILKLTFWLLGITLVLAIGMQLLIYNIDNYYCLSNQQLNNITFGNFKNVPISCGVMTAERCNEGKLCRNIFSYITNQDIKHKITQLVKDVKGGKGGFSGGLAQSFISVIGFSGGMYEIYRQLFIQVVLLPIFLLFWLLFILLTGIGMGEAMRGQTLQNWKRGLQKQNKNKSLILQNSNISFPRLIDPNSNQTTNTQQISIQIAYISQQLSNRPKGQKICTIVFNIISILQLFLIICNNLNFDAISTRNTGILLGVIFILWSFGLAFALYEYLTSKNKNQNQKKDNVQSQQNNKIENYLLIFQVVAYLLMLSDYILRVVYNQLLFQSQTQITPFCYAVLSFRVMFVLFNNGFDAQISYYVQKIIQNFANCSPVIGNVVITGIVIGFSWSYITDNKNMVLQIQNAAISIGFMFGNGLKFIGNEPHILIIKIILIFAFYMGIFHTKNAVLGYQSILKIDFSDTQVNQITKQYQDSNITQNNKDNLQSVKSNIVIENLKKLNQHEYYNNFRSLLIIIYIVISLIITSNDKNDGANIFKFCVDIYLLLDLGINIMSSGICNYIKNDKPIKILYFSSQIYLFISYFVPNLINHSITSFLHISRCFLLFSWQQKLNKIYTLIKNVLFHPKLKIYKLFIIGFVYLLMSACLISLYINRKKQQQHLAVIQKIKNLIIACTSFVYSLQWKFIVSIKLNTVNMPILKLCELVFNLIFIIGVVFLNSLIFFLMITFFVNRDIKNTGKVEEIIAKQFSCSKASAYNYEPPCDQFLFRYVKCVKIIIIIISIVLLGLLSGNLFDFAPHWRNYISIANLALCFIQFFIYGIESLFIKKSYISKKQGLLLALSLPGSFFLVFPVIKFSIWLQLSVLIRIFLFLSMLRILRLFPLLTNRQVSSFSSKMLRRISNQLNCNQILFLFLMLLFLILPLTVYQSQVSNTSISTQFINILTGSLFKNTKMDLFQFLIKILYAGFIMYPIKMIILSRIISCFLDNRGQIIMVLRDQICQVICQIGLLNQQQQNLYLPLGKIYHFSAKISKIFQNFSKKKPIKCLNYEQIMQIINKSTIPIYQIKNEQQNNNQSTYCILIPDIISYIYGYYLNKQLNYTNNFISGISIKQDKYKHNMKKSHFNINQYCCYLKIRNRIRKMIKKIRKIQAVQQNQGKQIEKYQINRRNQKSK